VCLSSTEWRNVHILHNNSQKFAFQGNCFITVVRETGVRFLRYTFLFQNQKAYEIVSLTTVPTPSTHMTVDKEIGAFLGVQCYMTLNILIIFQTHPWVSLRIPFFTLLTVYTRKPSHM
jgi:hypothetical protein